MRRSTPVAVVVAPAAAIGLALLLPIGCKPSSPTTGTKAASGGGLTATADAAVPIPSAEDLRARAETLWTARVEEDWPTAFQFEDLTRYPELTEEQFVEWSSTKEPFKYESCTLGDVAVGDTFGWVDVTCMTAMRRFDKMPARETRRWEKWHVLDGRWMPVPREDLEAFPEAPAERDLQAEKQLTARFHESWVARNAKDWDRLYQLCDPEDRDPDPSKPPYLPLDYIEHDVKWIQCIGDSGIVRVEFLQRISDPSMTKLAPNRVVNNERWIRRGGEWYLDLSNQEQ